MVALRISADAGATAAAVKARPSESAPSFEISRFIESLLKNALDVDLAAALLLLPGKQMAFGDFDQVVEGEAHQHESEEPRPDGVEVVEAGRHVDDVAEPALGRNEFADDSAHQCKPDIDAEGGDD